MNCRFCLLVVISVSMLTSFACSSSGKDESANAGEVVVDDGYKTSTKNEIVINDVDFGNQAGAVAAASRNPQETISIASDNSKISTTFDVYGNKIEKRIFNNNPRLAFIIFTTSAKGEKQVFVYGQNGDVKSPPENMLDKIMTAPADEIANSAGIYNKFTNSSSFASNSLPPNVTRLEPKPKSQFPIQNQQIEQPSTEEIKSPAKATEETAPVDTNNLQPDEKVKSALTKKTDNQ